MSEPPFDSPDRYRPHVNETFVVHYEGGTSEIVLAEVKLLIDDEIQRCFSLFFSRTGVVLPQQIHRLSHPVLGEFEICLIPVQQRHDSAVRYEAGFNLLKETNP